MSDPRARLPGLIALNCVTVIWGSQHAVIKHLVTSAHAAAPPTVINFFRFSLAAVTTGIISACRRGRTRFTDAPHTNVLRASAELALWQVLGFTLQLVGLQWTSASRSAFLLYLNAVLVPFFACVLGERRIGLRTWVAAFAAVSGTLLLTYDGGPPNVGDVWSLCAAAASALYIVRLSALSAGVESTRLSAVTLALTTAACMALPVAQAALSPAGFVGLAEQAAALLRHGWPALLYLSTVVTATRRAISPDLARSRPASPASPSEPPHRVPASSNLLQTFGQQRVGASEARASRCSPRPSSVLPPRPTSAACAPRLLCVDDVPLLTSPFPSLAPPRRRSSTRWTPSTARCLLGSSWASSCTRRATRASASCSAPTCSADCRGASSRPRAGC